MSSNLQLSPDFRFLLACIRQDEAPNTAGIDWENLTGLAARHRMTPLICRRIKSPADMDIPDPVAEELVRSNIANAARNAFLASELLKILGMLEKEGVSAICFKGPALAIQAYGDIASRQFDDIDLLVRKKDIISAANILSRKGYVPFLDMPEDIRKYHVDAGWGISIKSPESDYHLELVSNVVPELFHFKLPGESPWENAINIKYEDKDLPTLSPSDCLILLCVHGMKHQWSRLAWIADVDHLIKNSDIDWKETVHLVESAGGLRILLLGLYLAHKLAGTDLPDEVASLAKKDGYLGKLAETVMTDADKTTEPVDSMRREISFHLHSRERFLDRLLYISALIFKPGYGDWQSVRLPNSLFFLYYLARPFRLICKRGS